MTEAASLAAQIILDHARSPVGRTLVGGSGPNGLGSAEPGPAERQARGYSPSCGDEVVVRVVLDAEGRVTGLGWTGHGCTVSQASASMLAALVAAQVDSEAPIPARELRIRAAELVAGTATQGAELDEGNFGDAALLGGGWLTPQRARCAALAWTALSEAIAGD